LQRQTLDHELEQLTQRPGLYKVIVHLERPEAGLSDMVRKRLPGALSVKTAQANQPDLISPEKLLDPLETFRQYHQSQFGCAPEGELVSLFLSLLEEESLETA